MNSSKTVGEYLIWSLKNIGVDKVFGIPGDMVIRFFKLLEDDPEIQLFPFSHEPSVGFAAIGSARATQKPAVACVTYGVGGLNMLNSVACAYAEKTPLIVVSGGLPLKARGKDLFLHHMVKNFDSQVNVYNEVTQMAVILDDVATVGTKIDEALAACREYSLPVYIEVPSDIVDELINTPESIKRERTLTNRQPVTDAVGEIISRMATAERPVIMIGVEAERFGLRDEIMTIGQRFNVPVIGSLLARDLAPIDEPNFFGTYLGAAGNNAAVQLVDESDLLLLFGVVLSDVNLGWRLIKTKSGEMIQCVSRQVKSVNRVYDNVPLNDVLDELLKVEPVKKQRVFPKKETLEINRVCKYTKTPIVTGEIIDALNWFFSEYDEMPIISDTGDCLFTTLKIKTSTVMASAYYATMGFAVPASIGYSVTTGKRPMVLVGDGGFQMTGSEICHCPRFGINPIFILYNNTMWGMQQVFYEARFNELVNWSYAKMADLWGGKGYYCDDCDSLYRALEDAERQQTFTLLEVVTSKEELSEELQAWVEEQKRQSLS